MCALARAERRRNEREEVSFEPGIHTCLLRDLSEVIYTSVKSHRKTHRRVYTKMRARVVITRSLSAIILNDSTGMRHDANDASRELSTSIFKIFFSEIDSQYKIYFTHYIYKNRVEFYKYMDRKNMLFCKL